MGIHGGLTVITGRMEWMLDTESKIFDGMTEAEFLAKSIKDVSDHYKADFLDQKTLDWMNLIQCLLLVYGGRFYAIRSAPRVANTRPQAAPETPGHFATQKSGHVTQPPINNFSYSSKPENTVDIAGLGSVEFPDTDPRSPNYKPKWN